MHNEGDLTRKILETLLILLSLLVALKALFGW